MAFDVIVVLSDQDVMGVFGMIEHEAVLKTQIHSHNVSVFRHDGGQKTEGVSP